MGLSLAIQLFQKLHSQPDITPSPHSSHVEILLFESSTVVGPGAAYELDQPDSFRINTPRDSMDLVVNSVGSFTDWLLTQEGEDYEAERDEDFTLRKHYGRYLAHLAEELRGRGSEPPVTVRYITNTRVFDLERAGGGRFTLHTASTTAHQPHSSWTVDVVALCTGGFVSRKYAELIGSPNYSHNHSTHVQMLGSLKGDECVGVIGTRLTAIDIAVELERRGHKGKVVMGKRLNP